MPSMISATIQTLALVALVDASLVSSPVAFNVQGTILKPDMMPLQQTRLSLLAESASSGLTSMQAWLATGAGACSSGLLLLVVWIVVKLTSSDAVDTKSEVADMEAEKQEGN